MEAWREELYLSHHGIDGQKWGKKNGPPYPLGYNDHSAVEKKKNPKSSLDNYDKQKKKSKHRIRLETKYKEQGLSQEEAEKKANKRITTEIVLASVGGAAVAGIATYAIVKKGKDYTDDYINKDSYLYRVKSKGSEDIRDMFYATPNKKENEKYVYRFGHQKMDLNMFEDYAKGGNGERYAYNQTMKVNSKIKIASDKNAEKIFNNFVKNNPNLQDQISNIKNYGAKINNGSSSSIKNPSNYQLFNIGLAGAGVNSPDTVKAFSNELKKSGYSGIKDINDRKISGYNTKKAVIIFDKSAISSEKISKLVPDDLVSYGKKVQSNEIISNITNKALPLVISGAGITTLAISGSNYLNDIGFNLANEYSKALIKNAKVIK